MSSERLASIDSRAGFAAAVRDALTRARDAGAREVLLCDPTFDDWPLDELAVVETLGAWAGPSRKLFVLAHDFDHLARAAPRFAEWRRLWSHVVQCRSNAELAAEQVPSVLLVPDVVCIRLHDRSRLRGTLSERAADLTSCRERIDAFLQRSSEAFPATTLGL